MAVYIVHVWVVSEARFRAIRNTIQCELLPQCQNFDFEMRSDNKKKSYERRIYESVGDNRSTKKELIQLPKG